MAGGGADVERSNRIGQDKKVQINHSFTPPHPYKIKWTIPKRLEYKSRSTCVLPFGKFRVGEGGGGYPAHPAVQLRYNLWLPVQGLIIHLVPPHQPALKVRAWDRIRVPGTLLVMLPRGPWEWWWGHTGRWQWNTRPGGAIQMFTNKVKSC